MKMEHLQQTRIVRPSRRRIKDGSAIVLNSEKIRKVSEVEDARIKSEAAAFLSNAIKCYLYKKRFQRCLGSVRHIQKWMRNQAEIKRMRLFRQGYEWTFRQSSLGFGLILGWRARRLLKSSIAKSLITSIKEGWKVMKDIYSSGNASEHEFIQDVIFDLHRAAPNGNTTHYNRVQEADRKLAKSVMRQLFSDLLAFHDFIFGGAEWRVFPLPGYWRLRPHGRMTLGAVPGATRSVVRSPVESAAPRLDSPSKAAKFSTPPAKSLDPQEEGSSQKKPSGTKSLMELISHRIKEQYNLTATPDRNATRRTVVDDRPISVSSTPSTQERPRRPASAGACSSSRVSTSPSGPIKSYRHRKHSKNFGQCPNILNNEGAVSETVSVVKSARKGPKAHVELVVLGASKLKANRHGSDRLPGLEVSLWLPNHSSSSGYSSEDASEGLKQVCHIKRDFDEAGLSPTWNSVFYVPLPTPKLSKPNENHSERSLLEWWSRGKLKIYVVDCDRFNEDNFMGEATLLMSSFLSPKAAVKGESYLEAHGSYQLNKLQPSDRVSGTVMLHAFLHFAEESSPEAPLSSRSLDGDDQLDETAEVHQRVKKSSSRPRNAFENSTSISQAQSAERRLQFGNMARQLDDLQSMSNSMQAFSPGQIAQKVNRRKSQLNEKGAYFSSGREAPEPCDISKDFVLTPMEESERSLEVCGGGSIDDSSATQTTGEDSNSMSGIELFALEIIRQSEEKSLRVLQSENGTKEKKELLGSPPVSANRLSRDALLRLKAKLNLEGRFGVDSRAEKEVKGAMPSSADPPSTPPRRLQDSSVGSSASTPQMSASPAIRSATSRSRERGRQRLDIQETLSSLQEITGEFASHVEKKR